MHNVLVGIQNFLYFIEQNWTIIIIILGLLLKLYSKLSKYLKLSKQEKIDVALASIREIMIRLCTEAELDWSEYRKSGSIKRSEVIDQIFQRYPILLEYINQEELIAKIDTMIDEALVEVRKVISE